jgi:opacity protein-like surface antigen
MKSITLPLFFITLASSSLFAQTENSRFTFDLGAGFTETVGATRSELDKTGWNVSGGAGYNFTKNFGVMADLGYTSLGINGQTLGTLGVPGGNVGIFTALVDPIVHVSPFHHVDMYLTGGGGMFRQRQEFTAPTVSTAEVFNPFFGYYPAAFATTEAFDQSSVIKPGFDTGAGFEFGSKWHGKFFAEARWYHMFNTNSHTDFIPVTVGFRW